MGKLSMYVLDIIKGKFGVGVKLVFYVVIGGGKMLFKYVVINSDGCCDVLLLEGEVL